MIDQPVQRIARDYDRRWLVDESFYLIVWYDSLGAVHGFQLCYDKPGAERALTWISNRGFSHTQVDHGEAHALGIGPRFSCRTETFPLTGSWLSSGVMRKVSRQSYASSSSRRSPSMRSESADDAVISIPDPVHVRDLGECATGNSGLAVVRYSRFRMNSASASALSIFAFTSPGPPTLTRT